MEDETITIRDLLSELSLRQKLILLGKIYWHRFTDSRLVKFACIFCGGVYEWLFTGQNIEEVEYGIGHRAINYSEVERYLSSPSQIFAENLGKEVKPGTLIAPAGTNVTVICYCENCNISFPVKKSPWQCPNCGRYVGMDHALDDEGNVISVNPYSHKEQLTPADYGMNGTTLSDSKNFPEERPAWDAEIVRLLNLALKNSIVPVEIDDKELDYWFSQDYKPDAVVRQVIERGRSAARSSYFIQLPAEKFWSEK